MPPVLRGSSKLPSAGSQQSQNSTRGQVAKPSRQRKIQKLQDGLFTTVQQYLANTKPSQWSLQHLKSCLGEKQPAKQKWYFKAALEDISRTASPTSDEGFAARRVLSELNPQQAFATPMATFSIGSSAGSTIIYTQNNTINNNAPPPVESSAESRTRSSVERTTPTSAPIPVPDTTSPSLSQADYGAFDIPHFLDVYPSLRTKFELATRKGSSTLEDLLHGYLQDNPPKAEDNVLLQAGFIDIASGLPQLMSSTEYDIVKKALKSKPGHVIATCIKNCFNGCCTFKEFVDARDTFSCKECKYNPLCQIAIAAVFYTVHFLSSTAILPTQYLEGDYDVLWTHIIDDAFVSPHGRLHRKEKTSPLSSSKFDGLFIGGAVDPQEWLVIEVGRISQGSKETQDRKKLVEHCLRVLNHRRWYLGTRTNLNGKALVKWLMKFPVWGILCHGPSIEVMKLAWLTRGVGVITTFASRFPNHITRLQSLYRILEEVHNVAVSVRDCVEHWDELHCEMVGNSG